MCTQPHQTVINDRARLVLTVILLVNFSSKRVPNNVLVNQQIWIFANKQEKEILLSVREKISSKKQNGCFSLGEANRYYTSWFNAVDAL